MDLLDIISWLWLNALVVPMTNFLILLSRLSFGNFGIAIIIFTLIMRGITWPLTQSQLRSTRAMQAVQPRVQELQKKHSDPKRRSEETMKLYREAGVNPLGCVWPMLVQFPIWIALFQSIRLTLGATPESLLELSQRLYPWSFLNNAVPLDSTFLGLDLGLNAGEQAPLGYILAILVGASMWVQQRMMTPASASTDQQQQSMNQMMLWMMPLLFGWFTLSFAAGLALYWVATNVVSIALQYVYMGPSQFDWKRIFSITPRPAPAPAPASGAAPQTPASNSDTAEPVADEAAGEAPQDEKARSEKPKRRRRRRRGRQRKR